MQHNPQKLGGARYNKPHEVHDKLRVLGRYFNEFYDQIMRNAIIRWEFDADEVWVEGRFRATKQQMIGWTDLSKSTFHIKWRKIAEAGLIRAEEDGVWVVTMVIRKVDVGVSDAEVREMQERQLEMAGELREVKAIFEAWKTEKSGPDTPMSPVSRTKKSYPEGENESGQPDKNGSYPDKNGSYPDGPILFKGLKKKVSLSSLNTVISGFYRLTGQNRISKEKRERGLSIAKKLIKDGFSLEDIEFAAEWTPENVKEEVYDFAIIQHTVGQALAARDRIESERKAIEERDRALDEERSKREAEDRAREEIEAQKATLSADQRDELRQGAVAELADSGTPAYLMNEFLVGIKENELLRKQVEEKR